MQISESGASYSWWTKDGRHIVYVDDQVQSLWRVDVDGGSTLHVGTPHRIGTLPPNLWSISAMPDREKFLAIAPERAGPGSVTIVRNWRAALDRKR